MLLGSSGIFFLLHRKLYMYAPDQACSNQLLPRGPRRLKTIIMSQFSTLGPQTRSEQVEASSLSEWVQIVMAKLTGVIRDHESVSSPSASLYTVQTQAITQAVRHLKELFFCCF